MSKTVFRYFSIAVVAVKWEDIDFAAGELHIRRSIVKQRVGRVKTEASEKPVPLSEHLIAELLEWRSQTAYAKSHDYVFASHIHQGRQPYWMSRLMQIYIKPAAERTGVRHLKGWHTLRHYSDSRTISGEGEPNRREPIIREFPLVPGDVSPGIGLVAITDD